MGAMLAAARRWAAATIVFGLGALVGPAVAADGNTLTIKNACTYKIWIQQLNVDGVPTVVAIPAGKKHTYKIKDVGDVSTRFWPKSGCNSQGYNCKVGESQGKPKKGGGYSCPKQGCAPPVDSKIEVNWACVGGGCNVGKALTYYDISQVDGFTLPFSVKAEGSKKNSACISTNCAELDMTSDCPTSEDLSTNGKYPSLKKVDLRMREPKSNKIVGCFSPCEKLTGGSNYGGLGYAPSSDEAAYYCCPTPPISSGQCQKGPVAKTSYVKNVHKACHGKAYAYAYDDANGNHACQGYTTLTMTICSGKN